MLANAQAVRRRTELDVNRYTPLPRGSRQLASKISTTPSRTIWRPKPAWTRLRKQRTPRCILIGAVPGAAPPLIGWAAARGHLDPEAWVLFAIVFFWQFPHFMAIAWMYREDYDRAGYLILPRGRARARIVTLQTLLPLSVLVPLSLLPVRTGRSNVPYDIGASLLSLGFFNSGAQFALTNSFRHYYY
jgi:heme O synthase-like polyprenyltransferase